MVALSLTTSPVWDTIHFNCQCRCGKLHCENWKYFQFNWMAFSLCYSKKRFPFDTNNPIGYLIAVILEYIIIDYECFIIACTLSFGIGACWFGASTTKEIQSILHSINDKTQTIECPTNELKILFSEFIDTHSAIKQLSTLSETKVK